MQIRTFWHSTQKIKLHFWPFPPSTLEVRKIFAKQWSFAKSVFLSRLLHDDWTLTTKWDLCKKSIPTWSLDYREAIDTPTWSYLIGKNFFYVNQFGVCHAFLMNFRVFRPSPTTFIILARLNFTARGDIIVVVKGF